jgi:DNA polymerase III sliding clamp (beta) subunit (PCNA family)
MFTKENLIVKNHVSNDRNTIDKVYFHPKYTVATDGYSLLLVTSVRSGQARFTPFQMSHDQIESLSKLRPESMLVESIDRNEVKFKVNEEAGVSCKKENEDYPRIFETFPKQKPKITIRLNTKFLLNIITSIKMAQGRDKYPYVDIDIYGEEKVVRFRGENKNTKQTIVGLLMPMRK